MDQVLKATGHWFIFSAPYQPQSNEKVEVFHKYLKPTLKKLYENYLTNWDKYLNQVLTSYRVTLNLAMAEMPFFLVFGWDPNLPLHQLLLHIQCFLGDPESGIWLALPIAKKTLDENCIKNAQKTMDRKQPSFQLGDSLFQE